MTTIIIRKDHEGIYRGFYCMGHAGYAKKDYLVRNRISSVQRFLYWCKVPSDRFHNWRVKNSS